MNIVLYIFLLLFPLIYPEGEATMDKKLKDKLSPEQYKILVENGTEQPFNNQYRNNKQEGIYVDPVDGTPLFSSTDKYDSGTGWPSFTKTIDNININKKQDNSFLMKRTEVRTAKTNLHMGHVFNDGPSPSGKRYCINSASLKFIPKESMKKEGYGYLLNLFDKNKTETAILAGGCFWGVEAILQNIDGVLETTTGYTGGSMENPKYDDVKTGRTNYAEAVKVVFDPRKLSYKKLLDYFWRLHDPTTLNRQGFDYGTQYRSAIFYTSEKQKEIAEKSKKDFDKSGIFKDKAVTQIIKAGKFHPAEDFHQDYYKKRNTKKFCHTLRDK